VLSRILSKYPPDMQRITAGPDSSRDIGEFMPHLGRVLRFYKEKEPNYYDQVVDAYIRSTGDDPSRYDKYRVAPKTLAMATQSLKRYNKSPTYPDERGPQTLKVAAGWYLREFGPFMCDSQISPVSDVLEWLQTGKSAGYPLTLKYPYKEDYYGCPEGEAFLDKYWEELVSVDYVKSLCSMATKEEIRPSAKLDIGKIRTTASMDTNHVVYSLCYTLHSTRRLIATHLQHPSAVGVVPFYGGWHRLQDPFMEWYRQTGVPDTMALDGVEFDSNFKWLEMYECLLFDYNCLSVEYRTEENWWRMFHLYWELIHAPLVNIDGNVFGRGTGNPSGQGNTIRHNNQKTYMNLAQLWLLACDLRRSMVKVLRARESLPSHTPPVERSVFEKLFERSDLWDEEYDTFEMFKKHVRVVLNGDDLNVTVHPDCHSWFNVDVVLHLAPILGMQYTSESPRFERFVDLPFLGHNFALVDVPSMGPMYLPVIDCEKMRTNALVYNHVGTIAGTIQRANGFRAETFACESCRAWFAGLITYLRNRTLTNKDPDVVAAWKSYKTDDELWALYTGVVAESAQKEENSSA